MKDWSRVKSNTFLDWPMKILSGSQSSKGQKIFSKHWKWPQFWRCSWTERFRCKMWFIGFVTRNVMYVLYSYKCSTATVNIWYLKSTRKSRKIQFIQRPKSGGRRAVCNNVQLFENRPNSFSHQSINPSINSWDPTLFEVHRCLRRTINILRQSLIHYSW